MEVQILLDLQKVLQNELLKVNKSYKEYIIMRINLTKKDLVNSIYMQIGFSKKISENLLKIYINY